MAKIRKSTAADINLLMELRLEMLREVNGLERTMNLTGILSKRQGLIFSMAARLLS